MIIKLDLQSETPIYIQFVQEIKKGIASKKLAPGETMPSVRSMAADLGINMHTVNKAYQLLKQDGFFLIHRKKGVVINPELPGVDDQFISKIKGELKTLVTESVCRDMKEEQFIRYCKELYSEFDGGL